MCASMTLLGLKRSELTTNNPERRVVTRKGVVTRIELFEDVMTSFTR